MAPFPPVINDRASLEARLRMGKPSPKPLFFVGRRITDGGLAPNEYTRFRPHARQKAVGPRRKGAAQNALPLGLPATGRSSPYHRLPPPHGGPGGVTARPRAASRVPPELNNDLPVDPPRITSGGALMQYITFRAGTQAGACSTRPRQADGGRAAPPRATPGKLPIVLFSAVRGTPAHNCLPHNWPCRGRRPEAHAESHIRDAQRRQRVNRELYAAEQRRGEASSRITSARLGTTRSAADRSW